MDATLSILPVDIRVVWEAVLWNVGAVEEMSLETTAYPTHISFGTLELPCPHRRHFHDCLIYPVVNQSGSMDSREESNCQNRPSAEEVDRDG
jgi:hypothetical protein